MRNETQLIEQAKNGNRDAFALLAERYRGLLFAAGYSILRSKDEAEDIAQEALLRIFSKLHTFELNGSFARWSYVIARNVAIAYYRLKSRESTLDEISSAAIPQSEIHTLELAKALNTLPEGYRETVLMHYIGGYSTDEIAKSLDVAPGTIRSRLTRARRILRGELIVMIKRELKDLLSKEEYSSLVEWLRAFPVEEPTLVIEEVDTEIFDPEFKEGTWFFIPLEKDAVSFAAWYDYPEKKLTDTSFMRVTGKAEINGEECWEVCTVDEEGRDQGNYKLWYWSIGPDSIKMAAKYSSDSNMMSRYKDSDWDENQQGHPRFPGRIPMVQRIANEEFSNLTQFSLVPVGMYDVTVGAKKQRCMRVIEARNDEYILIDAYINSDGRTVLFRRYNSAPYWSQKKLGKDNCSGAIKKPAEADNKRIVFNNVEYYHWYDCITDAAMQCAPPMVHGQPKHWYHGSPLPLSVLASQSTVTPVYALAEAFAHKPSNVNVRIKDGTSGHSVQVEHDGKAEGYIYEVIIQNPSTDLMQLPSSGFFPGEEMLTKRELPLRLLKGEP